MYDFEWHGKLRHKTRRAAEYVLSAICPVFDIDSVLDVGCGDGTWLRVADDLRVSHIQGVDGPWTKLEDLQIPADRAIITDLQHEFDLSERFDLAISLEVAEHLSPSSADVMIGNMTRHSDLIIFGAAIPYQGGFRHINEQWQSFWCSKFASQGYRCFDLLRPILWSKPDVHFWYKQNALVYISQRRQDLIEKAELCKTQSGACDYPLDLVHPEKYEAIASYNQIAFRPLSRRLPAQLMSKIQDMVLRRT